MLPGHASNREIETLRHDLESLVSAPIRPEVFGANGHNFKLRRPLKESMLAEFEATHRIAFPSDYREFLVSVGNGGAGPYYGLFSLGEMDDGHDHVPWKENDGFVGILSKPFPHTNPWNDLTGMPEEDEQDEQRFELAFNEFDKRYWNPSNVNGAIPICHLGCALRQWLVVTGPEAGHVWCDYRADYRGLQPLSFEQMARVTFLQWYRNWLDGALRALRKGNQRESWS